MWVSSGVLPPANKGSGSAKLLLGPNLCMQGALLFTHVLFMVCPHLMPVPSGMGSRSTTSQKKVVAEGMTERMINTFSSVLRMEDLTDPEAIRLNPKCDRTVSLYGYLRGTFLKNKGQVHIPGKTDPRYSHTQ